MDFQKKYPVLTLEAVCTPLVFRAGLGPESPLPYPALKGIRHFTEYCGINDGKLRTALSRAHSDGRIEIFKDAQKVTRYKLADSQIVMGKATSNRREQPDGFIIAIFSFTQHEDTERTKVRDTLKYYGFKKLAQNCYINGRIDTAGLKQAIKDLGLEKNLYLFESPDINDPDFIDKILSVFNMDKRTRFLKEFQRDLTGFFNEDNLSTEELVQRFYYSGPVHWNICYIEEPPFPLKYLPEDYPLFTIMQLYADFTSKNMPVIMEEYLKWNS